MQHISKPETDTLHISYCDLVISVICKTELSNLSTLALFSNLVRDLCRQPFKASKVRFQTKPVQKVCSMIVLPSVTKSQAERSYRAQVQLFERTKLQAKSHKYQTQTRNQNNPKNTQWFIKGPPIQGHTSTLKKETRQRCCDNTRMFCVYALPECSSPLALALAFISMVDLRSTMACMLPSFFSQAHIGGAVKVQRWLANCTMRMWSGLHCWQGKIYFMFLRIHNMCTSKMSNFI